MEETPGEEVTIIPLDVWLPASLNATHAVPLVAIYKDDIPDSYRRDPDV